ncbi:hypothetical protein ElyMa_002740800 [Elysia marginata]|uniref:Reverse transcriptase domain-containing protein n=1 Tax=Elysia marginata TaxID=1093978 RepID=A0AAV4HHE4_9GAST|nr:hypothetical protein ElyMa_002740800 [Elysia marginata]
MGDLDYTEIDGKIDNRTTGPIHPATQFLGPTKDAFLIQHQKQPTRFRKRSSSEQDRQKYVKASSLAKRTRRNAKIKQEKSVAKESRCNPKAFWNLSSLRQHQDQKLLTLKGGRWKEEGGKIGRILRKQKRSTIFFFKAYLQNLSFPPKCNCKKELDVIESTDQYVQKILSDLHTGKYPGPDMISPLILARTADTLAYPVARIFRLWHENGHILERWRQTNITPILKTDSRSDASNYPLVRMTCIICKCMKMIIMQGVITYIQENNITSKHRHGFVSWKILHCQAPGSPR